MALAWGEVQRALSALLANASEPPFKPFSADEWNEPDASARPDSPALVSSPVSLKLVRHLHCAAQGFVPCLLSHSAGDGEFGQP